MSKQEVVATTLTEYKKKMLGLLDKHFKNSVLKAILCRNSHSEKEKSVQMRKE